jgi:hypothetical protein
LNVRSPPVQNVGWYDLRVSVEENSIDERPDVMIVDDPIETVPIDITVQGGFDGSPCVRTEVFSDASKRNFLLGSYWVEHWIQAGPLGVFPVRT